MKKPNRYHNGVRIIAGKHKGRKITVPDADGLRPTPDRIRETVFNWLQFDLANAHILDAFAGSGAMGLESLSRSAASVHFIDNNPVAVAHIQHLLQEWGERHARVQLGDALKQAQPHSAYDIIYLDPPFAADLHQSALNYYCQNKWLKPHGLIYIEMPNKPDSLTLPDGYTWYKQRSVGRLHFGLIGADQHD